MKLYLVERTDDVDWDETNAIVVVASNPKKAREIHPSGSGTWPAESNKITLIGTALKKFKEGTIICTDFKAG